MSADRRVIIAVAFLANLVLAQDFAFPERGEEDRSKQNAANRKPIFLPGRCKDNELLYPGDQQDDWICDCSPGFLYHPTTDMCYSAYRQGPCEPGKYLILQRNRAIPDCMENPCKLDGSVLVPFGPKNCQKIGQPGPCSQPELSFVLGVNSTTLDITCIRLSIVLGTRMGDDDAQEQTNAINLDDVPLCAKGCRRSINGTCPAIVKPKEKLDVPTPTKQLKL